MDISVCVFFLVAILCNPVSTDLPILARMMYANNVSAFDLRKPMPADVDIPRLREGRVGAFFWYEACTSCVRILTRR